MKRILVLCAAAMLFAAPAFAANAHPSATVYKGGGQQATQSNIINKTTVKDTTAINVGKNNTLEVGNVSNKGGKQTNVINKTDVKNSQLINVGEGNEMRIGGVYNEK